MKENLTDKDKRLIYALYINYPDLTQNDLAKFFSKGKDTNIQQSEISSILREQDEKGKLTNLNSVLIKPIRFVRTLPDYRK